MRGMYVTLDAELDIQRTIKRAGLKAFLCHVDNKAIIGGPWRRQLKCIGPKAKDAEMWIFIWEVVRRIHQKRILLEVEHVKAHCPKKQEKQEMSLFERFVTEGTGEG